MTRLTLWSWKFPFTCAFSSARTTLTSLFSNKGADGCSSIANRPVAAAQKRTSCTFDVVFMIVDCTASAERFALVRDPDRLCLNELPDSEGAQLAAVS